MEIKVATGDIAGFETGAVIVHMFEGATAPDGPTAAVDRALGGAISHLIARGEIKGKLNEVTLIHSLGKLPAALVAVTGLGKPAEFSPDRIRGAVAVACRVLRQKGAATIAASAPALGTAVMMHVGSAQAVAEGALLGLYTFRRHVTKEPEFGEVKELTIVEPDAAHLAELEHGRDVGVIMAEAAILARDMVNEPANFMTPARMVEEAATLARDYGLKLTVFGREQMRDLGMGALLGVAQGSAQPPKFIVLRYAGRDSEENDLALVGKGITFDSGGISIKPAEGMGEMKGDMAGGASVMAALGAIARLKTKLNVVALVPATENLPGGTALKPGDVVTASNGKTIEIVTTDAEGRLVLSDALSYARKLGARSIVDVATLTGACRVALGEVYTGAFTNNQDLLDQVTAAGAKSGELAWQLPLHDLYQEQNKSEVADIKNSGGRYGGAITAAHFLKEFVGDTPWVHLDIAGTSMTDKERAYLVKGATGVPVRTLVNLALSMAE